VTRVEGWKERYARLRAEKKCVQCAGLLLPEWGTPSRCPECRENRKPSVHKYLKSKKGRRMTRRYRRKPEVREARKATLRATRLEKKLSGECLDCVQPCLEESPYCQKHLDVHRAANRDYSRRRREADRLGVPVAKKPMGPTRRVAPLTRTRLKKRPPAPLRTSTSDPVNDYRDGVVTIAEAVIRYAELHNGISTQEVGDAFAGDDLFRNAASNSLRRAVKAGRLTVEGNSTDRVFYPVRHRRAA
jgi:hypothetical protein